jgi:hypothetical protein
MMTFLSTKRAGYSIKKNALTDVGLHVTISRFAIFSGSVTK